ncbi:MAG: hypothetical protein P8N02_01975 [Actinomycetota bacterium]|nr:hypothetical protein [Actinomycetota bacterium]
MWFDDTLVTAGLPAKAALILAYLAESSGGVPRSMLAGLLWSDHTEDRAGSSLRVALTRARAALPGVIEADRASVALSGSVEVDTRLIESGSPEDVLAVYGGDYLAGVEVEGAELFGDWAEARRQTLRWAPMACAPVCWSTSSVWRPKMPQSSWSTRSAMGRSACREPAKESATLWRAASPRSRGGCWAMSASSWTVSLGSCAVGISVQCSPTWRSTLRHVSSATI